MPVEVVGNLEPIDVLCEVGLPRIFTVRLSAGFLFLAYLADEQDDAKILLLAPTSEEIIDSIKMGFIPVRDALVRTSLLMVEQSWEDRVMVCYQVKPSDIPPRFLPMPGTTLYLEHMPALSVRAVGPALKPGSLPSNAVSQVFEGVRKSLKLLADSVMERAEGAVSSTVRELCNLPVMNFRFGSIEVDFRKPDGLFESEEMKAAIALLNRGIEWTQDPDGEALNGLSEEEQSAVFEALEKLAPHRGGAISSVEIGGSWVARGQVRLTSRTRDLVLRKINGPHPKDVVLHGELFAANAHTRSCTMAVHTRDNAPAPKGEEVTLRLEPEDYEHIAPKAARGRFATVVGRQQKNRIRVDWIKLAGEDNVPASDPTSQEDKV
jgi:hypothetical protein